MSWFDPRCRVPALGIYLVLICEEIVQLLKDLIKARLGLGVGLCVMSINVRSASVCACVCVCLKIPGHTEESLRCLQLDSPSGIFGRSKQTDQPIHPRQKPDDQVLRVSSLW